MNKLTTSTALPTRELKLEAMANMSASFELLCLASGMEALGEMMDHDVQAICGPRHARGPFRGAHRWGKTKGKIGFHGGNIEIERPRLRGFEGKERALPSWEAAVAEDWLGKWAMNQMLINVATCKFARSVRLPAGDVPASAGAGLSKSAASRRFVALSAARLKEWMASDLSGLDLLVIQIDGIHMDDDLILVAASVSMQRATSIRSASPRVQRKMPRPFKHSSTISSSAGSTRRCRGSSSSMARRPCPKQSADLRNAAAIQRCQVHKARNIMERLPKSLHASIRRVLRQAWELDDADKAEKLLRNLAQRLERDWSGVSGSILEGIDEILTVTRLRLPKQLRRSLACTNIIENVMGTARRVCRNVKRWRSASMAMRWTAAAMQEAAKGFRRLKAHKQLPALRAALEARQTRHSARGVLARQANAA